MNDTKQQFFERFLRNLFHRKGEGFVLKGGTAMQALFGEHRLTKDIDLDFANPRRTADSLHNTISKAIAGAAGSMRARDLQVSIPGKGEQTPRWKINFTCTDGQRHHVEIEVSRDPERAVPGAPIQVRYEPRAARGVAPFWVDIYDPAALIATKIAALLGREVPRDVYDLDRLISNGTAPGPELIRWAIERAGIGDDDPRNVVHTHLLAMDWSRFASQLLDALPPQAAERMNEAEWEAMKSRVASFVGGLLQ